MLCHKSFHVLGTVIAGLVLFIFSDATIQDNRKWSSNIPVPWFGVLKFNKDYQKKIDRLITVIMLSDTTGIADAKSTALLKKYNWEDLRNQTYVMFLTKEKKAWYATIKNWMLHPEYAVETLTTVALINIEHNTNHLKGHNLLWPYRNASRRSEQRHMYAIWYTDRNKILEQKVYQMEPVLSGDCLEFYTKEKLDSKWIRPKHFRCYHVRDSSETCVFEPGMVLVHYTEGKYYTLVGLSTWGPGCSLPARFIDFEPYTSWIKSNMPKRPIRRALKHETSNINVYRDKWMLERIKDESLTLRPLIKNTNDGIENEVVQGECRFNRHDELIYREVTTFQYPDTDKEPLTKTLAVYGLSLYDLNYHRSNYTCIQVLAKCSRKSKTQLEYTKGFEHYTPFEPYIKRLVVPHSAYQDQVYLRYPHTLKDFWENYEYEILGSEITHLIFRFEFELSAMFEINFYGNWSQPTTSTTSKTTTTKTRQSETTTKKRTRKPYVTVTVTTTAPYDGFWFAKFPKENKNKAKNNKKVENDKDNYWFNKWWSYNKKYPNEWYKG